MCMKWLQSYELRVYCPQTDKLSMIREGIQMRWLQRRHTEWSARLQTTSRNHWSSITSLFMIWPNTNHGVFTEKAAALQSQQSWRIKFTNKLLDNGGKMFYGLMKLRLNCLGRTCSTKCVGVRTLDESSITTVRRGDLERLLPLGPGWLIVTVGKNNS